MPSQKPFRKMHRFQKPFRKAVPKSTQSAFYKFYSSDKNYYLSCTPWTPAAAQSNKGKPSSYLPICLRPPSPRVANKSEGKWKVRTTKNHRNGHLRRMECTEKVWRPVLRTKLTKSTTGCHLNQPFFVPPPQQLSLFSHSLCWVQCYQQTGRPNAAGYYPAPEVFFFVASRARENNRETRESWPAKIIAQISAVLIKKCPALGQWILF